VEAAGVVAGTAGQASDGVLTDTGQACGLADAAAVGEVGQDRQGLLVREMATEEGRALTLGEAGAAGLAVQQPGLEFGAVAHADGEVAVVAAAVVRTVGIKAAEAAQIVHQKRCRGRQGQKGRN